MVKSRWKRPQIALTGPAFRRHQPRQPRRGTRLPSRATHSQWFVAAVPSTAQRASAFGFAMHRTTVAKVESGTRPTSVAEVAALAAIFDVEVSSLFAKPTAAHRYAVAGLKHMSRIRRYADDIRMAAGNMRAAQDDLRAWRSEAEHGGWVPSERARAEIEAAMSATPEQAAAEPTLIEQVGSANQAVADNDLMAAWNSA